MTSHPGPPSTKISSPGSQVADLPSALELSRVSSLLLVLAICPSFSLSKYLPDRGHAGAFLSIWDIPVPHSWRAGSYFEEFRQATDLRSKGSSLFSGREEVNAGAKREAAQKRKNIYLHGSSHRWP